MSTPYDPTILTRRTAQDMSAQAYRLVLSSGDNDMVLGVLGGAVIGALTNDVADGSTTAVFLPVQVGGVIKVIVGPAGCLAGSAATSDANGAAIFAAGGQRVLGIALEDHVAGDIGSFLVANGGAI